MEETKKISYSYLIDSKSVTALDSKEVPVWVEEVGTMVIERELPEAFFTEFKNWLDFSSSDGKSVVQIIYEIPDHSFFNLLKAIDDRLLHTPFSFKSPWEMDEKFKESHNAFIGAFYEPEIKTKRHIISVEEKKKFIESYPLNLPVPDFWECREEFFPHLMFVKLDEQLITGGTYRNFFEKLFKSLEKFCVERWREGKFQIKLLSESCSYSMSDESKTVDNNPKLKGMRECTIPGVGKVYAPYHVKSGGLRVYFWPDDNSRRIFITKIFTQHPKSKRF